MELEQRRRSNFIWVINTFIACQGAAYIIELTATDKCGKLQGFQSTYVNNQILVQLGETLALTITAVDLLNENLWAQVTSKFSSNRRYSE